jgi:hypothetical protein
VTRLFLLLLGLLALLAGGGSSSLRGKLLRDGLGVVRFVPLAERRGVDLDDRALDERVRADEFVV